VSPLRHDRAVADGTDAGPNGTGWIDPVRAPAQTGNQRSRRVPFKMRAETRLLEAVKTLFQENNDGLRGSIDKQAGQLTSLLLRLIANLDHVDGLDLSTGPSR
jgi:hypothetical protein